MQSQLKIIFIDDHAGLRDSLSYLLERKNPLLKFYLAGDSKRACVALKSNPDITIALVDLNLDGEDGLCAIEEIRKLKPEIKIIIYTMYNDPLHIKQALQKEVQGFITKDFEADEIEKALFSVSAGSFVYCKEAQTILYELVHKGAGNSGGFMDEMEASAKAEIVFKNFQTLTKKEQELFELLANKKELHEAAEALHTSLKTIQNKKSIIFQKMNLKDRLELVEAAKLLGVIL